MTTNASSSEGGALRSAELFALPLDELIGSMASALVRAQSLSSDETARFVNAVGFEAAPDGTPKVRTFDFKFSRSDLVPGTEDVRQSEVTVTLPLLSMMAIPTLIVEEATLDLDINIKLHDAPQPPAPGPATALAGVATATLQPRVLMAVMAPRPTTQRTISEEANMHVSVKFRRAEAPLGLDKLLRLLDTSHNEAVQ